MSEQLGASSSDDEAFELPAELVTRYADSTKGLFAPAVVIHEDDESGQKLLYSLSILQRVFLTIDDPRLSYCGSLLGSFMLSVILLSCTFYVISSLNEFKYFPATCDAPVCSNDPALCPGTEVCEPIPQEWMNIIELLCVIIFTVEYMSRVLLVWTVPPRLAQILRPQAKVTTLHDDVEFDPTKEANPEYLLLHELRFFKEHLDRFEVQKKEDAERLREIRAKDRGRTGNIGSDNGAGGGKTLHQEIAYWNQFSLLLDDSASYSGFSKTLYYIRKPLNVIDLLAVLPFYLELILTSGASVSVVRVLRLARVFRVFKMGKNSKGVKMLSDTLAASIAALSLLAFFVALGLVLFGAICYFVEGGTYTVTADYPHGAYLRKDFFGVDEISPFRSILTACYWAVITSTTVGYGDLVTESTEGKVLAILCAYYGVLLLALPITVIGNNFRKLYESQNGRSNDVLIYDCLMGISKSVHMECADVERGKASQESTQKYIFSRIMGIISTFDPTKQDLLKDMITAASDQANQEKAEEMKEYLLRDRDKNGLESNTRMGCSVGKEDSTLASPSGPRPLVTDSIPELRQMTVAQAHSVMLRKKLKKRLWTMPREPEGMHDGFYKLGHFSSTKHAVIGTISDVGVVLEKLERLRSNLNFNS